MDYPTDLPLSAVAVQVFEEGMSPQYDITWSFTYELSAHTVGDQFGYCMFLQDASFPLSGGGVGPDLGFTGNTLLSASLSSQPLNKPILGIGFDSLGAFASELTYTDGPTRAGVSYEPNSITLRDKNFNIITTQAISAFNLVSPGKKTIRARLGNYGRRVAIDYKNETDTFYTQILTQELTGIDVYPGSRYRPGVSFVKPLSTSNTNGIIVTTGFHVEGNNAETDESEVEFIPKKKSNFKAKQKRRKTPAPPKRTKIEDLDSDEEDDEENLPKRPPASVRNGAGGYDLSEDFGTEPEINRDVSRQIKQEVENDKSSSSPGSSNLMATAMAMQKERESS